VRTKAAADPLRLASEFGVAWEDVGAQRTSTDLYGRAAAFEAA
jgi:hypothetical protein